MQHTSKNIRLLTLNNKLIADFMGKDHELNQCISAPKYHKEWNWLMLVVEKIDAMFGEDNEVDDAINRVHNAVLSFDRDKTYRAVVEFIEWYNENKED